MGHRDARSEIERAASAHRDREAAAARKFERDLADAKALAESGRDPDVERRIAVRQSVLDSSLGGSLFARVVQIVAMLVCLLGPRLANALVVPPARDLLLLVEVLATTVICMVLTFGGAVLVPVSFARLQKRRLRRIGHGFDADDYMEQLSENRRLERLVVRVGFASPWEGNAKQSAADAVRGWMPSLDCASWDGETLSMSSKEFETRVYHSGGKHSRGGYAFTNAKVHSCFMDVVRRVLAKLDAANSISRIEVKLEGKIEEWDAKA